MGATPAMADKGSSGGSGDRGRECSADDHRGKCDRDDRGRECSVDDHRGKCRDKDRGRECSVDDHRGKCRDKDRGRECKPNDHRGKCRPKPEGCPKDPKKCPPPPEPPKGTCASADLVLLGADAKIVCLYLPDKGALATKDRECPGALLATGPVLNLGVCVFLPPASDDGASGAPGLPAVPDVMGLMGAGTSGTLNQVTGLTGLLHG